MFDRTAPAGSRVRRWLLLASCTLLSACASFPQPGELRATAAPYPGDGQVLHSLKPATRRAWFEPHALPERVANFSLAAFTTEEHLSHGLKPAWRSLAKHDKHNDGQVLAGDAIIPGSTLLGYVNADHWDVAISLERQMPQFSRRDSARTLPRSELLLAALLYVSESPPVHDGP